MRTPTEAEIVARGIEQILSNIPHYSQEENIRLLNDRLMTIAYRNSTNAIFATYFALYNAALKYENRAIWKERWIITIGYFIFFILLAAPILNAPQLFARNLNDMMRLF